MEEAKIASIGGCAGCRKSSVLTDGVCKGCLAKFGPRFAALAVKVRTKPEFHELCFRALRSDAARAEFVAMFGPVDPVPGSGDVRHGSP